MECEIFMGKEDKELKALNVYRLTLLSTGGHPVGSGIKTLKDAIR
jgi:tryptophan synthase beta subunit